MALVVARLRPARAQSVIRTATPVPEGTRWWREIHRFQERVEKLTDGQVRFNVYDGGIAGDELQVAERIRREAASAAGHCEELGKQQDDALLGGLETRSQFFTGSRALREKMAGSLRPAALPERVLGLLADYRAEHRGIEGP